MQPLVVTGYVEPLAMIPGGMWDQVGWWDQVRRNTAALWGVGARIRAKREELGMSQRELARRLDLDQSQLCSWEKERKPVPVGRIRRIEDTLGRCLYHEAA